MIFRWKLPWLLMLSVMLQACSVVDDYFLGKDNTPKPSPLPQLQGQLKLNELWSTSVGRRTNNQEGTYYKLQPVLFDKRLYLANPNGQVMALDSESGTLLWMTQLKQNLISGPALAQGHLAVGSKNSSLMVLNQDGKLCWEANLSGDMLAKPLITAHRVIAKTIDGYVYAFDLKTGKRLWKVHHGAPNLILKASSSPVSYADMIVVGFSDGKMDALDRDTGRVIWQKNIAYSNGASDIERLVDIDADPIVDNAVVYSASYQGFAAAMRVNNGESLWNKTASTYKNLDSDANALYMTDSEDVVWSIKKRNGQVNWMQTMLKAREITAPTHWSGMVLVGDKTGYLHAIDVNDGHLMGRYKMYGALDNAPLVQGAKIYVVTVTGQVTCYGLSV